MLNKTDCAAITRNAQAFVCVVREAKKIV